MVSKITHVQQICFKPATAVCACIQCFAISILMVCIFLNVAVFFCTIDSRDPSTLLSMVPLVL